MILSELFDQPHGAERIVAMSDEFHMYKDIGDREIRFTAHRTDMIPGGAGGLMDMGHAKNTWDVEFAEVRITEDGTSKKSTHKLTGSGNEVEVMSFVVGCLKEFVKRYKPAKITFSAKSTEESRVKLYKRMLGRLADDYEVEHLKGEDRKIRYDDFILTRKAQ